MPLSLHSTAHKPTNKKMFYERCDTSFVQKEGNKIVFIDEAGESTIGCGWNDVIGERVPNFDYAIFGVKLQRPYLALKHRGRNLTISQSKAQSHSPIDRATRHDRHSLSQALQSISRSFDVLHNKRSNLIFSILFKSILVLWGGYVLRQSDDVVQTASAFSETRLVLVYHVSTL